MTEPTVREQLVEVLEEAKQTIGRVLSLNVWVSAIPTYNRVEQELKAVKRNANAAIKRAKRKTLQENCCHQLDGCIENARDAGRL